MLTINDIKWIRANLCITFDKQIENDLYLENEDKKKILIEDINNNVAIIPIYNLPGGKMLEEGNWHLICDDEILNKFNTGIEYKTFKYGKNNSYYEVIINSTNNLNLLIKNHNNEKINNIIKVFIINSIYNFYKLFDFKKYDILFLTENSETLIDNLDVMYKYLNEKNKYKINIYSVNKYKNKSKIIRFKELKYISEAKYIFIDNYTSIFTYLNLKKNQKLIQLWHAGVGFKAIGYARFGLLGSPRPFYSSHRKYDYAIVDKEELIDVYKEVFGISKNKFLVSGMPRLEKFLSNENILKFKNNFYSKYNLKDKKILLYAPTYRGLGHDNAYYDMNQIEQDKIYEFCNNNNYVCIFKFHPFVNNKLDIKSEYKDLLLDLSNEYNINDLLYITNILITDYSSCAYEAYLLNRSMLFFRYDKKDYEQCIELHSSKIYNKYKEVNTFTELLKEIDLIVKNKEDIIKPITDKKINSCEIIEKNILV